MIYSSSSIQSRQRYSRTIWHTVTIALWSFFLLMASITTPLFAQQIPIKAGESFDKILAVVGDEIVLRSDVMTQAYMTAQQNPRIKADDPDVQKRILDAMINEKLLVIKAQEDSIKVGEEEVNERLEYQINAMRQQFGSEKRIEDVYGMSIAKIRREFREDIRKQMMAERLSQQKFSAIKVTAKDVEEFYTQYRDSLPKTPAQVEMYQIVRNVTASQDAREKAYNFAMRLRDSLTKPGANFGDFARRYSKDPGSAAQGGDLGFFNKGSLMPEYEKSSYSMQAGEISLPIETPFGYHIIQLIEKRSNSVNTRHILLKLDEGQEDNDRARKTLDSIRTLAIKGTYTFEDLAKGFSDDQDSRAFGGAIGGVALVEASKLPPDLKKVLDKLPDGAITEPLPYFGDRTKKAFHIVLKKKTYPEHGMTLADDFKRIESFAVNKKRGIEYEKWIQTLRKTIYWEIKK
jgi:peptidyl-prolyl cis-trans isomerase SurA